MIDETDDVPNPEPVAAVVTGPLIAAFDDELVREPPKLKTLLVELLLGVTTAAG